MGFAHLFEFAEVGGFGKRGDFGFLCGQLGAKSLGEGRIFRFNGEVKFFLENGNPGKLRGWRVYHALLGFVIGGFARCGNGSLDGGLARLNWDGWSLDGWSLARLVFHFVRSFRFNAGRA